MNIRPLDDRVLIEPISQEEKTKSGIVLPDTADKEKPEQGKVIAVGQGRIDANGKRIPMTVKQGDVVLFTKYGPSEVKIDSKEYLIAKEEDILAIIN
jgi:chaperonin GroES